MIIKFKLANSISNYYYQIRIYDKSNKLILSCYNNQVDFKVPYYGIYKIYIFSFKHCIYKYIPIYINWNSPNKLEFVINNLKKHFITINLKDQYYEGLPIMKGKVILWQNTL